MASSGTVLVGLWFDRQKYDAQVLNDEYEERPELPIFCETRHWLDLYFRGETPNFTPTLLMRGSDFRRRVWKLLLEIPYGHTVTYGEIARQMNCRSTQAIGGAIGHNPIAIIVPCHRVIGADGSMTGYAGGINRKARLLEMERGL